MNWQEKLTILIPILSLIVWGYHRIQRKADERLKQIVERFKESIDSIKSVENSSD